MAIKDLLVAYDGNDASRNAVRFAAQMARKYGASITGVHVFRTETYESHIRRWIPEDVLQRVHDVELEAEKAIETAFSKDLAEAGHDGEVRWIAEQGQPNVLLPRFSRFFDLLLIGQFTGASTREARTIVPEDLVTRAGKPVVVVPRALEVRPFKEEAVVAWDASRSAARALTDAMQILETKRRIDVVQVDGEYIREHLSIPTSLDIVSHIQRHGVEARLVTLEADHGRPGDAILEYCAQHDPDALIMGAYGRGKFGASLFGGVTRHVLGNMTVPVLLSH